MKLGQFCIHKIFLNQRFLLLNLDHIAKVLTSEVLLLQSLIFLRVSKMGKEYSSVLRGGVATFLTCNE